MFPPHSCLCCRRLSHPRVARLYGVVSHPPYWAVLELTINGDLKSFLLNTLALQPGVQPV